jgi:hypothetical protein
MGMKNITAELTSFPAEARDQFAAAFGSSFTDHEGGVTMFAPVIDDVWVPICQFALIGVVGEEGLVSFVPTDVG